MVDIGLPLARRSTTPKEIWRKPGALDVSRCNQKDLQRIQTYRNVLDPAMEPAIIPQEWRFWLLRA